MSAPRIAPTSPLPSLIVESLVVTDYASLPGGSGSGTSVGVQYVATGIENPAAIVVPITGLPASYVAIAQPMVRAVGGALVPAAVIAQTAVSVTVAVNAQPAAGDTINIVAAST